MPRSSTVRSTYSRWLCIAAPCHAAGTRTVSQDGGLTPAPGRTKAAGGRRYVWHDAAPAPRRRAARHRRRRPLGQRRTDLGGAGRRRSGRSRFCVVPELASPGYPPEDLLLKPGFVADNVAALEKVAAATRAVRRGVGSWGRRPVATGSPTRPPCAPAAGCAGIWRKRFLPNYGVFDEQRWFLPGTEAPTLFGIAGALVGVSICEDVWFDDGPVARPGARRGRRGGEPERLPLQPGPAVGAPGHASRARRPRRAAPSPTSTWSADRTNWSSTATR